MVMAISIFYHRLTTHLSVIAGYESGHTVVSQLSTKQTWQMLYATQAHTQPILSLDVSISNEYFLTSSADATIAKHPIPVSIENVIMAVPSVPLKTVQTKHAGQQGLRIRNDGRIFATAGWDSKVRVYSAKGMKELAVLKWHKDGCYSVAFADVGATAGSEGFEAKDDDKALMKRLGTMTVQEQRIWKAKAGHWLAAGSKDGKISLWDIY
jgi:WD40 repeat protein